MTEPANRPSRLRSFRLTAVLAVALAGGFGAWLLTRDADDGAPPAAATTSTPAPPTGKVVVAAALPSLLTLARLTDHPIYWAGVRRGTTYELTQTGDGKVFIRYLPRGVKLGARSAHLLVATYPVPDAHSALEKIAKEEGASSFRVGRQGLAVVNRSFPTNVYLAYPGSGYQIEVFEPTPGKARRLVESGAIKPIRSG